MLLKRKLFNGSKLNNINKALKENKIKILLNSDTIKNKLVYNILLIKKTTFNITIINN